MLQETKDRSTKLEQPRREAPMYSQVFLSAMTDYAYNTLHDYLVAQEIDLQAVELLASLMQLQSIQGIYQKETTVLYIWNDEASYAIGRISQAVPKLGGQFISPSGVVLK